MVRDEQDREVKEQDDIVIEPEQDEVVASSFDKSTDSQIKRLKKQLKEAKEQARENLDGWQRLKADTANSKKAESERLGRERERGAQEVLESLLPALDSFDSAMHGNAWEQIDTAWRQGMEFVYSQLVSALESHGVSSFGEVGDNFDSTSYDAAEHKRVDSLEQDGKVLQVLRKGYKNKSGIVRPARVVVGDFKN
jgi:molecular chaperone GrpE